MALFYNEIKIDWLLVVFMVLWLGAGCVAKKFIPEAEPIVVIIGLGVFLFYGLLKGKYSKRIYIGGSDLHKRQMK